ncbi:hypothetical protein [Sedimentitalea nanhaiensis]|uniref:Uncharacterized protein n=1 Tax=Sedimentitalea nanhaiensis TaxID=999627 RepID=A0A1I7E7K0_9RHOB|nr:hypothetical protein [Sedimentitalea nanhaiensis]SFU19927.1 hypothetical protein SAMN05216236_14825 [Sedimentitalea nanhaiensis]
MRDRAVSESWRRIVPALILVDLSLVTPVWSGSLPQADARFDAGGEVSLGVAMAGRVWVTSGVLIQIICRNNAFREMRPLCAAWERINSPGFP